MCIGSKSANKYGNRCNKAYICICNLHIHLNACIYVCIWPYIPIYAAFGCPRGVRDIFTVHSHPGS